MEECGGRVRGSCRGGIVVLADNGFSPTGGGTSSCCADPTGGNSSGVDHGKGTTIVATGIERYVFGYHGK